MVLVGDRRSEERHDAVASDLVHGPLVVVNRFHHTLDDPIEDLLRLLRIAACHELRRVLQIGEQDCDLLALACEHVSRLGEVLRRNQAIVSARRHRRPDRLQLLSHRSGALGSVFRLLREQLENQRVESAR